MRLFMDTWGWIAWRNRDDPWFEVVSRAAREAFDRGAMTTTNFVVAEAITLVYSQRGGTRGERFLNAFLDTLALPQIQVEEITADRFEKAIELRRRFRDKPKISFTDLTSMVVMRERGITDILTADRHFLKVNLGFRLVPGSCGKRRARP